MPSVGPGEFSNAGTAAAVSAGTPVESTLGIPAPLFTRTVLHAAIGAVGLLLLVFGVIALAGNDDSGPGFMAAQLLIAAAVGGLAGAGVAMTCASEFGQRTRMLGRRLLVGSGCMALVLCVLLGMSLGWADLEWLRRGGIGARADRSADDVLESADALEKATRAYRVAIESLDELADALARTDLDDLQDRDYADQLRGHISEALSATRAARNALSQVSLIDACELEERYLPKLARIVERIHSALDRLAREDQRADDLNFVWARRELRNLQTAFDSWWSLSSLAYGLSPLRNARRRVGDRFYVLRIDELPQTDTPATRCARILFRLRLYKVVWELAGYGPRSIMWRAAVWDKPSSYLILRSLRMDASRIEDTVEGDFVAYCNPLPTADEVVAFCRGELAQVRERLQRVVDIVDYDDEARWIKAVPNQATRNAMLAWTQAVRDEVDEAILYLDQSPTWNAMAGFACELLRAHPRDERADRVAAELIRMLRDADLHEKDKVVAALSRWMTADVALEALRLLIESKGNTSQWEKEFFEALAGSDLVDDRFIDPLLKIYYSKTGVIAEQWFPSLCRILARFGSRVEERVLTVMWRRATALRAGAEVLAVVRLLGDIGTERSIPVLEAIRTYAEMAQEKDRARFSPEFFGTPLEEIISAAEEAMARIRKRTGSDGSRRQVSTTSRSSDS